MDKIIYLSKAESRDLKDLCNISLGYEILHIEDLKDINLRTNIIGVIISIDDFESEASQLEKIIKELKVEKNTIVYGFGYKEEVEGMFSLDYFINDGISGVHILLLTKLFNKINENQPLVYVKNARVDMEEELMKFIEITGGVKVNSMEESDILFYVNNSRDNLDTNIEYLYNALMTYGKSIALLDESCLNTECETFVGLLKKKELIKEIMSYSWGRGDYNLQYSLCQAMIAWLYGNNKVNKELKRKRIKESSNIEV